MIIGELSIGGIEIGGQATSLSETSKYSILIQDSNASFNFLIDIDSLQIHESINSDFPYAIGEYPIGGLASVDQGIQHSLILRYGSKPFFTKFTDSTSSVVYKPKVITPFNYETSIPYPLTSQGLGDLSFGVITIAHTGGDEDHILGSSINGRGVTVRIGGIINEGKENEYILSYDEYGLGFQGIINKISANTSVINFGISGFSHLLHIALANSHYTGEGGFEGGENLKDVIKQLCFGLCRNVSPVLIDEGKLIFQFHDGSIEEFLEIRDKGYPLGNLPLRDISELGMDSIFDEWEAIPGYWISDVETGCIRLGSKPSGRVTGDLKGDNGGSKGYVDSIPDIILRWLELRTSLTTENGLDASTFSTFFPLDTIGYVVDSHTLTVEQAISELLSSSDAWGVFSREGGLLIGRYWDTSIPYTPVAEITDDHIFDITCETLDQTITDIRIGYKRNWTSQSKDELAAAVDESKKELYSRPNATVSYENPSIKSIIRDAIAYNLDTYFENEETVNNMIIEMLSKYGKLQKIYRVVLARQFLKRRIGEIVRVTSNKLDLQTGKRLMILGIVETSISHKVELILWGS